MAFTTVNKPTDYFNTTLWTGDGNSTQNITGTGFNADFIWLKGRSGAGDHQQYDQVRGAQKMIRSNDTAGESDNSIGLTAFGSDGFTMGSDMTGSGSTFVSWNWKAGTTSVPSGGTITPSSVSLNTSAGFGIYKYTGTGSNGTIAHGLGSTPRLIIVKKTNTTGDWRLYYNPRAGINGQEGRAIRFDSNGFSTDSTFWNGTAATSTVFSLGTHTDTNGTGATFIAYAFADVVGYQKFCGWYVNANSDGPFIYTGFRPAFFMMFNINNSGRYMIADNKRNPTNEKDKKLSPHNNNAEATTGDIACDFLSNGIKVRGGSTSDVNHTNLNMMYGLAIAESPLVGTNNIPNNAR